MRHCYEDRYYALVSVRRSSNANGGDVSVVRRIDDDAVDAHLQESSMALCSLSRGPTAG